MRLRRHSSTHMPELSHSRSRDSLYASKFPELFLDDHFASERLGAELANLNAPTTRRRIAELEQVLELVKVDRAAHVSRAAWTQTQAAAAWVGLLPNLVLIGKVAEVWERQDCGSVAWIGLTVFLLFAAWWTLVWVVASFGASSKSEISPNEDRHREVEIRVVLAHYNAHLQELESKRETPTKRRWRS